MFVKGRVGRHRIILRVLVRVARGKTCDRGVLKSILSGCRCLRGHRHTFVAEIIRNALRRVVRVSCVLGRVSGAGIGGVGPIVHGVLHDDICRLGCVSDMPSRTIYDRTMGLTIQGKFSNLQKCIGKILEGIIHGVSRVRCPGRSIRELSIGCSIPR